MSSSSTEPPLAEWELKFLDKGWYIDSDGYLVLLDPLEDDKTCFRGEVEGLRARESKIEGVKKVLGTWFCSGEKAISVDWANGMFHKSNAVGKLSAYRSQHNLLANQCKCLSCWLVKMTQ